MRIMSSQFKLIFSLWLLQAAFVTADLPVHCMKKQILGNWVLKQSASLESTDIKTLACGHSLPDKQETSYQALGGSLAQIDNEVRVSIDEDFVVRGKEGEGKWTLVYDEGWELNYLGTKYTHFFKYEKVGKDYQSDCSQTLVGWYNNIQTNMRGCSQAFKVDLDGSEHSASIQQAHVVQPKSVSFNQISSRFQKSIYTNKPAAAGGAEVFAEMKKTTQATGLNHEEIVNRLNKIQGKTWTAKVPINMAQMSLEKMNSRAGIRQKKKAMYGSNIENSSSFIEVNTKSTDYSHFSKEDTSALPKEFSWADKIHPPRSQEDCGSCYAIATTAMLSSRLWITTGDNTVLSPQHSLACNFYNQGCDGGYGILVSKFYSEFEAVPESCHQYMAKDGQCSSCNVNTLEHVFSVTDYEYIGGSYGKSSELKMMQEIKKNGPIVVSFEPKFDFMYYQGGIYHSVEPSEWIQKNETQPSWEKVDHSVLCYGWGENEDGKFWLLQNSWGPDWGENGNFRMRRGTDESNIESMGERAFITKKKRNIAHKSYTQLTSHVYLQQKMKTPLNRQSAY